MPARRAPDRALNHPETVVDSPDGIARRRRGPGGRLGRMSGVGVAAALVCSGLGLAAPLAASAAPHAAVRAAGVNPAPVLRLRKARPLHNTVRHFKDPVYNDSLGMRAVRLAATRAGDPYVWGAEGPRAFDCSGLVMWVYDHLGKNLPRTAGDQYVATRHISHSQMKPGDLVFFAHGSTVYHVAIYAGHGWIWAAPYPGKDVEKEKLWTNAFMVGRVR